MAPRKKTQSASEEIDSTLALSASLVKSLTKDLGEDIVHLGSEALPSDITGYISTQCAALDYIIGQPGIPIGRLTTIYGKEGSGKSTIALHLLAETQAMGGLAILIDSECRFSRDRAADIGVKLDDLIVITGKTLEATLQAVEKLVIKARKNYPDLLMTIVYDSLAGSPTEALMDKEIGSANYGPAARVVSTTFPRIIPLMARAKVALVIVNQIRSYIKADPRASETRKVMGQRYAMIAEGALVFYSSLMLFVNSHGTWPDEGDPEGIEVRVDCKKNSLAPREGFRAELKISYLDGIDRVDAKFSVLERVGLIARKGAWYQVEGIDKSFLRKDFGALLMEYPAIETLIDQAPLLWHTGHADPFGPAEEEDE